jgi:hypothetical protein
MVNRFDAGSDSQGDFDIRMNFTRLSYEPLTIQSDMNSEENSPAASYTAYPDWSLPR